MTEEPTIAEIVSNENGQTKEEVKPEPEKLQRLWMKSSS